MSEVTQVVIVCKGTDKASHPREFVGRVRHPSNPGEFGVTRIQLSNRINAPTFENNFETGEIATHQKTPGGVSGDLEHDRVNIHCPYVHSLTGQRCAANQQLKNGSKAREKFDEVMLDWLEDASTRPENQCEVTLREVASKIR